MFLVNLQGPFFSWFSSDIVCSKTSRFMNLACEIWSEVASPKGSSCLNLTYHRYKSSGCRVDNSATEILFLRSVTNIQITWIKISSPGFCCQLSAQNPTKPSHLVQTYGRYHRVVGNNICLGNPSRMKTTGVAELLLVRISPKRFDDATWWCK